MAYKCRVVADSISLSGARLTSMEVTYPRCVHPEALTHRMFSRSASSNRALGVMRIIREVLNDPFEPVWWGESEKGMVARGEVSGWRLRLGQLLWTKGRYPAVATAYALHKLGFHRQIVNRVLEPWQWITVIYTATEWENFFWLRCHPDCYTPDTEVLTEQGWKLIEQVQIGERVYSMDPGTDTVELVSVDEVIDVPHEGEMLSIKAQAVDLCTTLNHRHLVATDRDKVGFSLRKWEEFKDSKHIAMKNVGSPIKGSTDLIFRLPAATVSRSNQYGDYEFELPERKLPLGDLLQLVGFYISDGWCNSRSYMVGLCKGSRETMTRYENLLSTLTESKIQRENEDRPAMAITFQDKQLHALLSPLGQAGEKRIPEWVWRYDESLLRRLYEGLCDGDMSYSYPDDRTRGMSYTTSSEGLAGDIQRLCLHLGISASVLPIDRRGDVSEGVDSSGASYRIETKQIHYNVSINQSKNMPSVRTYKNDAFSVSEYSGRVVCLRLPKLHTLYVRRNGKAVWSGNSQPEFRAIAEMMQVAYRSSVPTVRAWHLPYVTEQETIQLDIETCVKLSIARCARTSYLSGGKVDVEKDLALYRRLDEAIPPHSAPGEHVATANANPDSRFYNLTGWASWRWLTDRGFQRSMHLDRKKVAA